MQGKAAEMRSEQQQSADAKRADAALSEQQKAVDARLRRVKSVAKSENGEIEELGKGLQNHKKKERRGMSTSFLIPPQKKYIRGSAKKPSM